MYITKWNVIGFLISAVFGGIIGVIVFVGCWAIFRISVLRRGLLFIQSYLYLKTLWETGDVYKANYVANDLSPSSSAHYYGEAKVFAHRSCGGEQLPVIQAAKSKGFVHRKKPVGELIL